MQFKNSLNVLIGYENNDNSNIVLINCFSVWEISNLFLFDHRESGQPSQAKMLRRIQRTVSSQGKREEANHEIQAPFENVSFMCITRENFVRKHLIKVVRSRYPFQRFMHPLSKCTSQRP